MAKYLVLVTLPGGRSAERDRKIDLEMGKEYFSTFFLDDQGEKLHLPVGSYHHDQPDIHKIPEAAHAAATRSAQSVDPLAAVVVFPFEHLYYAGKSKIRA
jgi:hypothetical protein